MGALASPWAFPKASPCARRAGGVAPHPGGGAGGGAGGAVVTRLEGNGRAQGAPRVVTCVDGFATFEISEAFRTVWYRVAFRTANDAWSAGRAGAPPSQVGGEATRPSAN